MEGRDTEKGDWRKSRIVSGLERRRGETVVIGFSRTITRQPRASADLRRGDGSVLDRVHQNLGHRHAKYLKQASLVYAGCGWTPHVAGGVLNGAASGYRSASLPIQPLWS
jgi:hypothetical protein